MNRPRLRQLAAVGIGTFAVIALAGFVLIWVWVPTLSTYRLVAFITCMFAVTGAVLAMIIYICSQQK